MSLVFKELAPLHVHNQQEHPLTVDHEFVDVSGYHWSLRAMVLHIGATRDQGHFVAHVLVGDNWWLCNDGTVTQARPPANPRKATFLLYERTPVAMGGISQADSQRGASQPQTPSQSKNRHALSMPSNTRLAATAQPTGDPTAAVERQPLPNAGLQSGASQPETLSQSTTTTIHRHARSMPSTTQLAAMAQPTGDPQHVSIPIDTTPAALAMEAQPSPEFVQAVAVLLQKQRVRVRHHLQVRVRAHQVHLRAQREMNWDERHAPQGMSHASVAQAIQQDKARSAALAATGCNAFSVMMGAAPQQLGAGPKTLQAFVDGHWQL